MVTRLDDLLRPATGSPADRPQRDRGSRASLAPGRRVLAAGGLLALLAGAVVVREPALSGLGLLALAAVGVLMLRVDLAVLAYVAVEPFGDLLPGPTVKLAGALLFAAWVVRLLIDPRPARVVHPVTYAAAALLLVLTAATAANPNGAVGAEIAGRYLSYLAVLVVLVDLLRTRVAPRRVVAVYVWSCTAAAAVGLAFFLRDGGRATGPVSDPNDLAFYLVAALPFALLLAVEDRGSRVRRLAYAVAGVLLLVGIAATFSRGAGLGIAAAVAVAALTRLVHPRHLVVGGTVALLALGAVWASAPAVVDRALTEKQFVADSNVESRFASWRIAAEMTVDHPLLGTGPGGYRTHFPAYEGRESTDPTHLDVAHQMLLDVSSELGLLGLAAFLAVIGLGVRGAWRGLGPRGRDRRLAAALLASFAAVLVSSTFLSEQYYLPLWLLVALGAALEPDRDPDREAAAVPLREIP